MIKALHSVVCGAERMHIVVNRYLTGQNGRISILNCQNSKSQGPDTVVVSEQVLLSKKARVQASRAWYSLLLCKFACKTRTKAAQTGGLSRLPSMS